MKDCVSKQGLTSQCAWLENTEWEVEGKKLDLEALSRGPKHFLPGVGRRGRLDELMEFLGEFLARSEGRKRIGDLVRSNRGAKYIPNLIKAAHPAHVLFIIMNLQDQWKHKL